MASGSAAVDAELVLQAEHVETVEAKKVGRFAIVAQTLLLDLEPHLRRIVVAFRHVIHGQHAAPRIWVLGGDGLAQVVGEGGDAALARRVVGDECDLRRLLGLDRADGWAHRRSSRSKMIP